MAILIDPQSETVTEADGFDGSLEGAYKVMGCDLVDIVILPHGNMLIVDDEGLLKPNRAFKIEGYHSPLAGKALLVGDNYEDFKQPPKVTLEEARSMVSFPQLQTKYTR